MQCNVDWYVDSPLAITSSSRHSSRFRESFCVAKANKAETCCVYTNETNRSKTKQNKSTETQTLSQTNIMPDITSISNRSSLPYRREAESPFRDNADLILPCFVNPLASTRDDQIRQVAIQICPFLIDGETNHAVCSVNDKPVASSLSVKPLLGGLSNELFIVGDTVLIRIHPDDGVSVVDRQMENRLVAWLSRQHMAPIFYGRFQNGRLEELYPNVQPLSCQEMAPYGPSIAQVLADFHSLVAPNDVLPKPAIPSRYETVDQWVRTIQDSRSPHQDLVEKITAEWTWLKHQLLTETISNSKPLQFIREVVLTHMDCQYLNILKDTTSRHAGSIRLIDFEYAGWNPRAADIANTFCEHCDMSSIRADYEKEYPSETVQNNFLKAYLERCQPELLGDESALAVLRAEIGRFTLLSHLGWAAWSIVMVQEGSNINFDYVAYAKHRMDGYELGKKLFFSTESGR